MTRSPERGREKDSLKSEYDNRLHSIETNSKLTSLIKGDTGTLTKQDYVTLYRRDYNIVKEDGKDVLQRTGEYDIAQGAYLEITKIINKILDKSNKP